MAPIGRANTEDIEDVEEKLKDVVHSLYQVMVQTTQYDTAGGRPSKEVIANELKTLSQNLQAVHMAATDPKTRLPHVPQELIQYVENGRNPDIYTREFVELVRRGNQLMRGKMNAFASFRDVLAGEMKSAMPELSDDVDRVLAATATPDSQPMTTSSTSAVASNHPAPAGGGGVATASTGTAGVSFAARQI